MASLVLLVSSSLGSGVLRYSDELANPYFLAILLIYSSCTSVIVLAALSRSTRTPKNYLTSPFSSTLYACFIAFII